MLERRRTALELVRWLGVLGCVAVPATAWAAEDGSAQGLFVQALGRGPLAAIAAAFVGGLLVSLTPCVYPMIAITVSVFGARTAKSRTEAAALSSVFVLGMALMFTALGVGAAASGTLFGSALSNRWVVSFVGLVFLALSASMFGAFELALPSSWANRLATVGGIGFAGAFVLGLVSALVAAPCTGPVLGGILLWIATSHRLLLGTGIMLTFALGLGVPFFIVGTFAVSLPKSGAWMLGVKWFFGAVLAVVALYFLRTAVPVLGHVVRPGLTWVPPLAIALVVLGCTLAWLHVRAERHRSTIRHLSKPFKLASIAPAIVGGFLLAAWSQLPRADLHWVTSESEGRKLAQAENRPMIVDFGAAWCGACNELRTRTFANDAVRSEASRFVAVSIDATDDDDPQIVSAKDKYRVVGLPTVVLVDSRGQERKRFAEFVPPEQFLDALHSVD
ncbi:MAG TPA: cytochrome c biogenesis protein CcdA [Polyangiaceae bacterium]|nr:cytochrome c biogenesis protein CcdA [Polyangiaceae bacterium]